MNVLCRAVNRGVSARKKGAFQFNGSIEHGKICISFPIENKKVILNDNLRDVIGFKQNIIIRRRIRSASGMDRYIFADYAPGFSLGDCLFIYAPFVETSRVGIRSVPLLCVLERKRTQDHIHLYNIKHLQ